MLNRRRSAARQRGLSIVELMVGVTIGLLVVAASALLVSGQLTENRRLMLEIQVQQDLRASADIIVRDLRRAGIWNNAAAAGVWSSENSNPSCNRYATVTPDGSSVVYHYYRSGAQNSPLGVKLENGVLKTAIQGPSALSGTTCEQTTEPTGWQELTDSRTLKITRLNFELVDDGADPERLPCPKLCTGGGTGCWPEFKVRLLKVEIDGEAVNDPSVKRSVKTLVKLRNDFVEYVPASSTQMCPA
ncbi:hypothetical protein CLD22_16480 [Rubrivivax gelatinosus]|nr:hypothetical protein [Rubrivivax gelatinosus]